MKPYLLQMLKELALLGATKNRVEISSLDGSSNLTFSNVSYEAGLFPVTVQHCRRSI